VKIGNWQNFEQYVYARHDFHTGRNLVLVLGTNGQGCIQRLATQFQGQSQISLFSILLALTSSWSRQSEKYRWQLDYTTQEIEFQTGHSSFQSSHIEPLTPEELSLNKDISIISDSIQNTITGASNMANIFSFLSTQLQRYACISAGLSEHQVPGQLKIHLCDALSQCLSQTNAQITQMHGLKARVDAQWRVVSALIAQRDSQANINISKAAKEDNILMQRIAFVTMIFLPATFMATFFSMGFFHVGSEDRVHLVISKWIWLYPVCTIPLTVILALNYRSHTWLNTQFRGSRTSKMLPKREKSCDVNIQTSVR